MHLLHIDSSALGGNSVTRELSAAIVARWRDALPDLRISYRDLDVDPVPHVTGRGLSGADADEVAAAARTLEEFLAADVIVIDADEPWVLDPAELKSKCKNTPFDEARLTGRVVRTIVAGRTVYEYV